MSTRPGSVGWRVRSSGTRKKCGSIRVDTAGSIPEEFIEVSRDQGGQLQT